MSATVGQGRPYRGDPPEVRATQRRERLLAAGLELFGSKSSLRPTIAEICAAARVTTRNFYESFDSLDDLLLALYERLLTEQALRIQAVLDVDSTDTPIEQRARLVIETFVRPWANDPRKARVAQVEIRGVSPDIDRRSLRALWGFAKLIASKTEASPLTASALVGAVNQSLMMWHALSDAERPPVDELIDTLVAMAARTLAPA